MMTDVGAPPALPDISLLAPDGSESTVHAQRAGRPAVVYFLRASTCPVCAAHVRTLLTMQADGELGGRVLLLVVPGGASQAARVARRHGLLDDRTVWASGDGHAAVGLDRFLALQHSGVLLVDEAGVVVHRRDAANPMQGLDRAELRTALGATA
jgi:peroxiredoxin